MLDGIQEVLERTQPTAPRLRIAVGRKTGTGPLVTETPMSQADRDAHAAASHVRPTRAA